MPNTAVIYARISKDDRGDHLGVDRQERLCRELANTRKLDVLDVLVDNDVSAYKARKRPQFERLVELLRDRQADAVLCYHADRLYRRATDLERLVTVVENSGAQVHTVAAGDVDLGTASGRMVARMLGAAAQHEVERMSERSKAKQDELAAKGRPSGGRPPYGYMWRKGIDENGRVRNDLVIDPGEAKVLRQIAERVLEGASQLSIARSLDAAGVKTREGRPWHHATVRSVLINPAVAGLRVHRRKSRRSEDVVDSIAGPGDWEPILDRMTWESVRAVIADPARKHKRPARRYLLSGLVQTVKGDPMIGRPDKGAGGELDRRTYATRTDAAPVESAAKTRSTKKKRPAMSIGADELEELVVETTLQFLDEQSIPLPGPTNDAGGVVQALEAEFAELAELRGAGTISLAEWMAAREPLQARLDEARRQASTVRRPSPMAALLARPGAARGAWPKLGFDDHGKFDEQRQFEKQREILTLVIEAVVISKADRGRWTPIEDRVDVLFRRRNP